MQSQVIRFNKGLEKSVHPVSGEGSGEEGSGEGLGLGGFGAMLGQVQQGLEKVSGRLWCRARSGSVGFRRRFRRRSGRLCRRARFGSASVWIRAFNRFPEKVPEKKVPEKVRM